MSDVPDFMTFSSYQPDNLLRFLRLAQKLTMGRQVEITFFDQASAQGPDS
jgi:hypothetical protein